MNSCPYHENSTHALDFGDSDPSKNFPQPMFIQIGDTAHEDSGQFFYRVSDVLDNGVKYINEYQSNSAPTPISTINGGTELTWTATMFDDGSVPSYINIIDNGDGPKIYIGNLPNEG